MIKFDINERPELEAVARFAIIDYLKQTPHLYEAIFDEVASRSSGDETDEEIEQEVEAHVSNMFVFGFQALQEKLNQG